jgi:hypothetical protein
MTHGRKSLFVGRLVSFSASPKVSREGEPMVRFTGAHVETTIILACTCLSSRGDAV